MLTDEAREAAFRGAGFIALVLWIMAFFVIYGMTEKLFMSVGLAGIFSIVVFVYSFGAGIGEW